MQNYLTLNQVCCSECKNNTLKREILLGPILCLDVEYFFSNISGNNFKCSLLDIPIQLILNSKKYELVGAIRYTPNHYIAYSRDKNNVWDCRDDLTHTNFLPVIVPPNLLNEKLLFSLFFYVLSENI